MSTDADEVAETVIFADHGRPVVFFKQMAHHLVAGVPQRILTDCTNALLIRDPVEVLTTIVRQLPSPGLNDIGIAKQRELLHELRSYGQRPAVLDARRLQNEPERVLSTLCERIGIEWDPAMLSWPAGPKPEDGAWAPAWYGNAHRSEEHTSELQSH